MIFETNVCFLQQTFVVGRQYKSKRLLCQGNIQGNMAFVTEKRTYLQTPDSHIGVF
jgi:hypothetical protein